MNRLTRLTTGAATRYAPIATAVKPYAAFVWRYWGAIFSLGVAVGLAVWAVAGDGADAIAWGVIAFLVVFGGYSALDTARLVPTWLEWTIRLAFAAGFLVFGLFVLHAYVLTLLFAGLVTVLILVGLKPSQDEPAERPSGEER